jgi:tetraacyldisaccharide 4'-kinase
MKLVRFLLFPFAVLYGIITSVRNIAYNTGLVRATSFDLPIIAVGNLSVGGTGKSPLVEYLIRLLEKKKTAILSRGYKRKTNGFALLDSSHERSQKRKRSCRTNFKRNRS